MSGCLFCVHGVFTDPIPLPDGSIVYGPGQPVLCELFGLVIEREECADSEEEPIQEV